MRRDACRHPNDRARNARKTGATAIEYGLIIALVVIAMIAGLTALADTTTGMWGNVNSKVANAR
ncbi:Flp family type IVb pilin [Sphingomonas sp. 22L2VL55-3]